MQVIMEGKVGTEGMENHQDPVHHFQFVLCQCQDRILCGAEQKVQCFTLILVHDLAEVMGQRKHKMKARDIRDHLRLSQRYPTLFIEISPARAVAVTASAGTHSNASAGFAPDQGIPKLPGLAPYQGIHNLKLFFRNLMGYAVPGEMGREIIPKDMLTYGYLHGNTAPGGFPSLPGKNLPQPTGSEVDQYPGYVGLSKGFSMCLLSRGLASSCT